MVSGRVSIGGIMAGVFLKILVTLGTQLLTSVFLGRTTVLFLRELSKHTTNTLDDDLVNEVAKALGCPDLVVGKK